MEKFLERLKKFSEHELVCFGTLLIALLYGMFYLDIRNPLEFSLSEIGRYNPPLFILWSVVTGLGLFFNIFRFYRRIDYKAKLGRICLFLGLFFLVLTFCNLSREPVWYWIHVATAILFAVLAFAALALGLLSQFRKSKKYTVLTCILCGLMLADVLYIIIGGSHNALNEFIPVILAFVTLAFTNFTDFFKLDEIVVDTKEKAESSERDEEGKN